MSEDCHIVGGQFVRCFEGEANLSFRIGLQEGLEVKGFREVFTGSDRFKIPDKSDTSIYNTIDITLGSIDINPLI